MNFLMANIFHNAVAGKCCDRQWAAKSPLTRYHLRI